jgi:hypothetical protein
MNQIIQYWELTVSLDQRLCLFHLFKQVAVANHSRCVPDFSASLIKTSDAPDNGSFRNVCQICDLVEWLP